MALQEDLNLVMGHVMTISRMILGERAALTPFAVVMTAPGDVLHISGDADREPADTIDRLTAACSAKAKAGEYRAVAIAYDVRIEAPGGTGPEDAVAVNFDHKDNASVVYCLPYGFSGGEITMKDPLTDQGEHLIFGQPSGIIRPD
ncbi:MAG: hypothetical protein VW268_04740 [Rhodospirillaceae bacterium]